MIKILAPHPNTPIHKMDRVLCIYRPTRIHPRWEKLVTGCTVEEIIPQELPFWRRILVWKSYQHYARSNPRTANYLLDALREFLQIHAPNSQVDLLIEHSQTSTLSPVVRNELHNVYVSRKLDIKYVEAFLLEKLKHNCYDTMFLLYPDAIGYGWGTAERNLSELSIAHNLVLNGRRRIFRWDEESRRALRWRRFVEGSWLVEIVLAPVLVLRSLTLMLHGMRRSH